MTLIAQPQPHSAFTSGVLDQSPRLPLLFFVELGPRALHRLGSYSPAELLCQ